LTERRCRSPPRRYAGTNGSLNNKNVNSRPSLDRMDRLRRQDLNAAQIGCFTPAAAHGNRRGTNRGFTTVAGRHSEITAGSD
jgi:hypothetical protein